MKRSFPPRILQAVLAPSVIRQLNTVWVPPRLLRKWVGKRSHCFLAGSIAALFCLFLLTGASLAQSPHPTATNHRSQATPPVQSAQQPKNTVSALLVSDIHFEPFGDPAKAPQLAAAPASQWQAILAAPPSPDAQKRFQSLQQTCNVRGADTSFALFESSLKAMRIHASGVGFVALSGDLVSHAFQCEYHELFPHSPPGGYRSFVEKTMAYVIGELDTAFPGTPVYVALGNNDTDCGDYRLDAHSEFLATTGKEVTKDLPAAERKAAEESFAAGGYYSVSLPAPINNARLLVLNDLFMSKNYAACSGKAAPEAAEAELAWLQQQLDEARANKQKVWVMGHIPPGVDLYSTVRKLTDVCGGQKPVMFLSSETLAETLAENSDVVQLAIFAHTHMDEIKLLKAEMPGAYPNAYPGAPGHFTIEAKGFIAEPKAVAVKLVPSISPIHGNSPSFVVAQVDRSSAALKDYRVFAASNQTGVNAQWTEEYDFAQSYKTAEFTAPAVNKLVSGFAADYSAKSPASQQYIRNFLAGTSSPLLSLVWPEYVCSLSNDPAQAFRACVCPAVAH
jgi:sphingomyelin phosphodiesterase acid-like 3